MVDEKVEILITARDKASAVLKGVGDVADKVIKTVTAVAVAGAAATVALSVKAVDQAADAEEMMSKLSATFEGSSDDMIATLDKFAEATGRSSFALREQATDLGAVLKALGFTSGAAADLAAETTKLAVDIGSFNNLPSADVANRITRAYTGEFESLKALGVVINQAKLEQELLNRGIEGGTKAATDQQKAMAVNAIIMRQTADAQGDAERTAGSFTNQMIGLKAVFSDFLTEVGTKLLPVITPFITKLKELAIEALPLVLEKLDPLIAKLQEFGNLLLAGDIRGALETFIPAETIDKILEITDALKEFITEAVIPFVRDHGKNLVLAFLAIKAVVTAASIISSLTAIASSLAFLVNPITLVVAAAALMAVAWIKNWEQIKDATKIVWKSITGFLTKGVEFIKSLFSAETWIKMGRNIINGLIEGVQAAIASLFSIFTFIGDGIAKTMNKKLGIKSPSEVFAGIGKNVMLGLGEGITNTVSSPTNALSSAVPQLTAAAGSGGFAGAGAGAGAPVVINFTHAPAVSLASAAEFEEKVAPLLQRIIRAEIGHRRAQ